MDMLPVEVYDKYYTFCGLDPHHLYLSGSVAVHQAAEILVGL
jgi:hypothetical protein